MQKLEIARETGIELAESHGFADEDLARTLDLSEIGGKRLVKELKRCVLVSPQATGHDLKQGEQLKKLHFLSPKTGQIEEGSLPEIIREVGHPWKALLPIKQAADRQPEYKEDWDWLKIYTFNFSNPEWTEEK